MRNRVFLTVCIIFLAAVSAGAQEYTLKVDTDKKIIYIDKLNLPGYICASEVLQILPEFASRENESFNTYDIQYDGKSVGMSRDVMLVQTRLQEIEKIEISTSSVSTQQNGSYSGTINFIPRKADEGTGGELFLDGSTMPVVMGTTNVNFKKNRFTLRSFATVEGYWPSSKKQFEKYNSEEYTRGTQYTDVNYFEETARVNLEYETKNGTFKGWYMESLQCDNNFQKDVHRTEKDMSRTAGEGMALVTDDTQLSNSRSSSFSIYAKGQYEHRFNPDSKLKIYAGYEGNPTTSGDDLTRKNLFDAEVKYLVPVLRRGERLFSIETGGNTTLTKKESPHIGVRSTYLSPFATLKFKSPKWSVEVAGRYQYFNRDIMLLEKDPYDNKSNDFTANANIIWQFRPHRAIRVMAYRNIVRPSDIMVFPGLNQDYDQGILVMGNPNLKPTLIHSVEADYICDWQSKKKNNFTLDLGIGFVNADGLFEKTYYDANGKASVYVKYTNSGIDNLITANMSFIYQSPLMTLSFAANVFTNLSKKEGMNDYSTKYNLSFTPIFNFPDNWMLSGRYMYNSPVNHPFSKTSESIYAKIRFGKKIGRWTVHLEFSDIFNTPIVEENDSDGMHTAYTYDMYKKYIGIGCSYRIGNLK